MKVNCNIYRARLWLFNGCLEFLGAVSWAISAGLDVFENAFFLQERKTDQTRRSKLSRILKILI